MSAASPTPTEIRRLPDSQRLRLLWDDGHRADYAYRLLRGYCPCAACQGHAAVAIRFHEPEGEVDPVSIQPVGNYGISIQWSDGHATGIYRWDFLREICPCSDCVAARAESTSG